MVLARREFVGGAAQTTLNGDITAGSLSITATSGTGYPTGGVGKFVIVIDPGTASEEKILCDSRTSNTFAVNASGRGYDNTVPIAHTGAAIIQHVFAAIDANDDNDHIYTTTRDDHTQYSKTDGTRAFTGGVTINTGGLTVTAGGETITAGGLTVAAGGAAITGTSSVTGALSTLGASGTLNTSQGVTVAAGGLTVTAGGLTVAAGTSAVQALTATTISGTTVTGTGEIKGTDFNSTGLTGAVTPTRYVGGVNGAAPSTGTFLTGDFAVDITGYLWICTVGGSPGTWKSTRPPAPGDASVATSETTTSVTYVDLTTVGPAVTVTTGTSAWVSVYCLMSNANALNSCFIGYAISGATTLAASDATASGATSDVAAGANAFTTRVRVTGLTAGSNTFTAKYRVTGGTGTFSARYIAVEPL